MQTPDLRRIRGLASLIGNTPLLAIEFDFQGRRRTIYAKAEHLNMTGSIKDRMAFDLSTDLLRDEPLKPGFLAPDVTLVSMRAFKRVCHTCCDPAECTLAAGAHPIDEELPVCVRRGV